MSLVYDVTSRARALLEEIGQWGFGCDGRKKQREGVNFEQQRESLEGGKTFSFEFSTRFGR